MSVAIARFKVFDKFIICCDCWLSLRNGRGGVHKNAYFVVKKINQNWHLKLHTPILEELTLTLFLQKSISPVYRLFVLKYFYVIEHRGTGCDRNCVCCYVLCCRFDI